MAMGQNPGALAVQPPLLRHSSYDHPLLSSCIVDGADSAHVCRLKYVNYTYMSYVHIIPRYVYMYICMYTYIYIIHIDV